MWVLSALAAAFKVAIGCATRLDFSLGGKAPDAESVAASVELHGCHVLWGLTGTLAISSIWASVYFVAVVDVVGLGGLGMVKAAKGIRRPAYLVPKVTWKVAPAFLAVDTLLRIRYSMPTVAYWKGGFLLGLPQGK